MIDLHTHSTVSDGSDTPEALVDLAVKAGLSALALTDHDRQDGVLPARKRAHAAGIELVAGARSLASTRDMHLLVYFLEPAKARSKTSYCASRPPATPQRASGGPPGRARAASEPGGARSRSRGSGAGRPHVAAILVRKGLASSVQDAFDRYLAKGRPAYLEKERLEPVTAVELSLESGALPVLAHPLSLGLVPGELERTVRELAEAGLAGLEAIYGRYSREERAELAVMAAQAGLAITGGSDHHGSYKPDLSVGSGGRPPRARRALAALRDRLLD